MGEQVLRAQRQRAERGQRGRRVVQRIREVVHVVGDAIFLMLRHLSVILFLLQFLCQTCVTFNVFSDCIS